jgi:hypothetical protein
LKAANASSAISCGAAPAGRGVVGEDVHHLVARDESAEAGVPAFGVAGDVVPDADGEHGGLGRPIPGGRRVVRGWHGGVLSGARTGRWQPATRPGQWRLLARQALLWSGGA